MSLVQLLIRIRNYLLFAAALAVLAGIPLSEQLQFDQRIESFFAPSNPDIQILKQSRVDFGNNEFVIVAWTEDKLFGYQKEEGQASPASLDEILELDFLPVLSEVAKERIHQVGEELGAIRGVDADATQHLANLLDIAPKYKPSRRSMLRLFEGTLVGNDGRTTGIALQLLPENEAGIPRQSTVDEIRKVAAALDGEVAVAGEPVQVLDMFRMVSEDGKLLFLVSLALLSVVLAIMFRGVRWVLMPVGIVLSSVILTRAALVLVGAELSMVSSMLSSLVTVIGIATCMHVIVHYRDLRTARRGAKESTGAERQAIAAQTLSDMAVPIFWTCLTTGIGFASLFVSQITPVRSFAVMMCLATGMVLLTCLLIMPAALSSGSRLRNAARVPLEKWLDSALHTTCHLVEKRPFASGMVSFLAFAIAVPGILSLEVETDFSRNFKDSSEIVRSLQFVEGRLGGAGSWEVSFDTPEKLTDDFLESIELLTTRLRECLSDTQGTKVLSLTDVSDLPPRIFGPAKTLQRLQAKQPELIEGFYRQDRQKMRIVLRSFEQQSSEAKAEQIVQVRSCVKQFFAEHPELAQQKEPSASGLFVLLAELINSLLQDQLMSFFVACAGIALAVSVAFGSLRIGIISLFPNVFPIAIVMGILGWIGMPVNIGTAMITSVSMGLTVDSTIHYITSFERARKTMSVSDALKVAHAGAGRAVVFAHCALVLGFLVLTASRFIPLVYFGALLSLSMAGGIFGDLVLLPLLLRWTSPADSAMPQSDVLQSDVRQ
ncbi:MAG: MMPL family transporter [Fuerstiella sp.]